MQEDGETVKKLWTNETTNLWYAANCRTDAKAQMVKDGVEWTGIYLGGKLYKLTRSQDLDCEGNEIPTIWCSGPKYGCTIARINVAGAYMDNIIVGFSDEDAGQKGGNCQKAVMSLVSTLLQG